MNKIVLRALLRNQKEAAFSVLPVTLAVTVLALTPLLELTTGEVLSFIAASVFMIAGIGLFNLGADTAMTPMGSSIGSELTKTRKIALLLPSAFLLGVLITIAEPDLTVLASQVSTVMDGTVLVVSVGIGVGLCLVAGVTKILSHGDLSKLLFFSYLLIFALCSVLAERGNLQMLPLAFDSGGVTTGPVSVPFLMALGIGIAGAVGGDRVGENSFGLISLCSAGPLIAVIALSMFSRGTLSYTLEDYSLPADFFPALGVMAGRVALEVLIALSLIVGFFLILQFTVLRLRAKDLARIGVGLVYTFVGLVVFLTAVNTGLMPVGYKIGTALAKLHPATIVIAGTVTGIVVVLAEPAVRLLTRQVGQITGGAVSRKSMLIALSCGVGISIGLSCLRIICGFSLLYYLVPGYILSLLLSFFVPGIYTSIAFDSGGVASGPLTSSFILPMMVGICATLRGEDDVLSLAFGVVAMVAMVPLITIQALGFRAIAAARIRRRNAVRRILDADDSQIIYFTVKEGGNGTKTRN